MANANVNVNTNNHIYGTLTCSSGTLNIDDSFIGDQIRTSIENGISRDEIFKAFDELFSNPKINWITSKEECLKVAEEFWDANVAK